MLTIREAAEKYGLTESNVRFYRTEPRQCPHKDMFLGKKRRIWFDETNSICEVCNTRFKLPENDLEEFITSINQICNSINEIKEKVCR